MTPLAFQKGRRRGSCWPSLTDIRSRSNNDNTKKKNWAENYFKDFIADVNRCPLLMYGQALRRHRTPVWTLSQCDRRSFVIACHIFVAFSDCCYSCCCCLYLVWCGIFVSEMWAMLLSENWVICSGLVCGRDGLAEISMTKGLRWCSWWQRIESNRGVGKVNREIK